MVMWATWTLWALAGVATLALVGLLLVILGLRGRRVGDHPHCRRCGFDVSGSTGEVCTECGADLKARRATRTGMRRRRAALVVLGLALLLPALTIGGMLGWGWISDVNWQAYKPAWWLVRELDSAKAPVSDAAVAELGTRMKVDALSPAATADVVEWVLARQGDLSVAWKPAWGDLVEMAFNNGKTSDAQWERYAGQVLIPSLAVRPRIRVGDPLPMRIEWEKRFGTGSVWDVYPLLDELSFGGQQIPEDRERGSLSFSQNGSAFAFRGLTLGPEVTTRSKPGVQPLEVELELLLRRSPRGRPTATSDKAFTEFHARRRYDFAKDVDVAPAESDPGWLTAPADEREAMVKTLSVAPVKLDTWEGHWVTGVIEQGAPRKVGRRLVVIVDGKVVEGQPGGMTWFGADGNGYTVRFPLTADDLESSTVTLVLLPDEEWAKQDVGGTAHWGEAIIFRNVPASDEKRDSSPMPPYIPATDSVPPGPGGGVPQWLIDELSPQ